MDTEVPGLSDSANEHFMGAVAELSEKQEVVVSEDVYSKSGVKLLAKGAKVSSGTYDRVVNHKLAKPIEACLVTAEQPSGTMLVRLAEDAIEAYPLLSHLLHWVSSDPLEKLEHMRLSPAAGTLLNVVFARGEDAPQHAVITSLIAMCLACAYPGTNAAFKSSMCLAGLLHDAGELYVNPAIREKAHKLGAEEWLSYSYHPVVGAALAREICHLDNVTQRAILEHHESSDGFGYPRSIRGPAISLGGQIMALAETLAALIIRPSAEGRISVALKIMPGERESALANIVFELLKESKHASRQEAPLSEAVENEAHEVFLRIANIVGVYDSILQEGGVSRQAQSLLDDAFSRFVHVQHAFASTGIANLADLGTTLTDTEMLELRFEARCVLNEIAWRIQKISRELILKAAKLTGRDTNALLSLAQAMSGMNATDEAAARVMAAA